MNATNGTRGVTDVAWSGVSIGVVMSTGFFLQLIVGNTLGLAEVGTFMFSLAILLTVAGILSGGIHGATLVLAARECKDPEKAHALIRGGVYLSLCVGVAGASVLLLCSRRISMVCNVPQSAAMLRTLAVSLPIFMMNRGLMGGLNCYRKMSAMAIGNSVKLLMLVATVLIASVFAKSLVWIARAFVVTELCLFPVLLSITRRYIGLRHWASSCEIRAIGRLAIPLTVSSSLSGLASRLNVLIAAPLLADPARLGLFSISLSFAMLAGTLSSAVQKVFVPTLAKLDGEKNAKTADSLIYHAGLVGVILTGTAAAMMSAWAPEMLGLLFPSRPEVLECARYIRYLTPAVVFFGGLVSIGGAFAALQRPRIAVFFSAGRICVRLVLLIVLIPLFSVSGAAIATGLTWILAGTAVYCVLSLGLNRSVRPMKMSLYMLIGACVCVVVSISPSVAMRLLATFFVLSASIGLLLSLAKKHSFWPMSSRAGATTTNDIR